jgi:hypothetical protein
VQEFDDTCALPNKSCVYIAYLDSVEYFRPAEARTMVYHEIMVGYLKWVQTRGFKQCHIWSCPPQRGDNFVFWCHPGQQRTPSRERLNAWYNSILLRSSKLGILEDLGSLWSSYFSFYSRKEKEETQQRQAAKNSFVGGGLVALKTHGNSKPLLSSASASSASVSHSQPHSIFPASPAPAAASVTAGVTAAQDLALAQTSASSTSMPAPVSTSTPATATAIASVRGRKEAEPHLPGSEEAPICPPIFEGDFWVNECLRVHRLVLSRSKGCDGQDRSVNQRRCRDVLKQLMGKHIAAAFCRPVDPVKLNIPDYPLVIKRPMDLGTARDRLRSGHYQTVFDFAQVGSNK